VTGVQPRSDLAHEHGTTRCEMLPRSAGEQGLPTPGAFRFQQSTSVGDFPGGPSPCPRHYNEAFDYYAASALSPARWHARVPFG